MVLYEQHIRRNILSGKEIETFTPLPIPGSQPVHFPVQETAVLEVPFVKMPIQYINICSENLVTLYTAEDFDPRKEFFSKRLFKEEINKESIVTTKGTKIVWRDQSFKAPEPITGNFHIAVQRVRNKFRR